MNFGRRGLVGAALAASALVRSGARWLIPAALAADKKAEAATGPVTLPELPWDASSLDPVISARAVAFHYGRIHRDYVENANTLVAGTPYADMPLVEIVKKSAADPAAAAIFQNAAQAWNHDFYWRSLAPRTGGAPGGMLGAMLTDSFGSYDQFHDQFVAAAAGQFGSGWVWLALERANKKLAVVATANAATPVNGSGYLPLGVLDVWEHAYYLDYQNRRKDHAVAVLDRIFNWRFVEKNLEQG